MLKFWFQLFSVMCFHSIHLFMYRIKHFQISLSTSDFSQSKGIYQVVPGYFQGLRDYWSLSRVLGILIHPSPLKSPSSMTLIKIFLSQIVIMLSKYSLPFEETIFISLWVRNKNFLLLGFRRSENTRWSRVLVKIYPSFLFTQERYA